MKLGRIQAYKNELACRPTQEWGEVLFRLVNEAAASVVRNEGEPEFRHICRELEVLKMKLGLVIPVICIYSLPETYTGEKTGHELRVQAKTVLDKINKIDWLVTGGASLTETTPN